MSTTAQPFPPVLESKLQPSPRLPWTVSRPGLVNRLRASAAPIAALVAPAGFGKTTLLAQWVDRDARPHAWLTADEHDDDPAVLVRCAAAALDRAVAVEPSLLEPLASPDVRSWPATLARLAAALSSAPEPIIFVLDGVEVLASRRSLQAVSVLADHLPEGSTLALSGRSASRLPIARLRAAGRLFELRPDELAMTAPKTRELLRCAGVDDSPERVADLMQRTEGWPAGLYLAALSLEETGDEGAARRLHERFMDDYVRHEVLSALSEAELSFLTRISFLEAFSWPLCAAVDPDNQVGGLREPRLRDLLVAQDGRRGWYRLHRPFRDVLRSELERREPAVLQELNGRAAGWYEAQGLLVEAVGHARGAGEIDRTARLVSSAWLTAVDRGQLPRWHAGSSRWIRSPCSSGSRCSRSREPGRTPSPAAKRKRRAGWNRSPVPPVAGGGATARSRRWLSCSERRCAETGPPRCAQMSSSLSPGSALEARTGRPACSCSESRSFSPGRSPRPM